MSEVVPRNSPYAPVRVQPLHESKDKERFTMTGNADNLSIRQRGHDPVQVAISLANNRASKVAKLREEGGRCAEMAERFQASLDADVEAFIAKRKCGAMTARMVREAAAGTWL